MGFEVTKNTEAIKLGDANSLYEHAHLALHELLSRMAEKATSGGAAILRCTASDGTEGQFKLMFFFTEDQEDCLFCEGTGVAGSKLSED